MATGQTWGYWYVISSINKFTLPLCVEFDVVAFSDTPRCRWIGDNTSINVGNISVLGHYKYFLSDTSCTLSINGGTPTHLTQLENASKTQGLGVFFELDTDTDSVTYKNFIVYYL